MSRAHTPVTKFARAISDALGDLYEVEDDRGAVLVTRNRRVTKFAIVVNLFNTVGNVRLDKLPFTSEPMTQIGDRLPWDITTDRDFSTVAKEIAHVISSLYPEQRASGDVIETNPLFVQTLTAELGEQYSVRVGKYSLEIHRTGELGGDIVTVDFDDEGWCAAEVFTCLWEPLRDLGGEQWNSDTDPDFTTIASEVAAKIRTAYAR